MQVFGAMVLARAQFPSVTEQMLRRYLTPEFWSARSSLDRSDRNRLKQTTFLLLSTFSPNYTAAPLA